MAKIKAGVSLCDGEQCGEQVVWRKAESGSYSYTCQHCDFRAYAPAHSDAARRVAAKFAPVEPKPAPVAKPAAAKPAPVAKPEAKPDPAPAVKAGGIWDHLVKGVTA